MCRLRLFIFIDAFGWEVLQRHSFLDEILHTKVPLGTVLGYSSTCDPTILTGKKPEEHGHFSFFYFDPEKSPFRGFRLLNWIPRWLRSRGRFRWWLSKTVKKYFGFTGYFHLYNMPFEHLHLFDYSEKRDIYRPGGINNGQGTVFDRLREEGIPYFVSDWTKGEDFNLRAMTRAIREGNIRTGYLYLAGMDAIMHAEGTQSEAVSRKIEQYDRSLRDLLAVAHKNFDDVEVFVFSDHGMMDVAQTCDLMGRIEALGLRFGEDYAAVYDSTMARFWCFSEAARERISSALRKEERGKILSDKELSGYGCKFPNDKYGEIFFLMNPGVLICPSHMGENKIAAMHGYAPEHKDSAAMFATNCVLEKLPGDFSDLFQVMVSDAPGGEMSVDESLKINMNKLEVSSS